MTDDGIAAVAAALGGNPLFEALDHDARVTVARHMELVTFPAAATVIRQGDRDRAMYLVVDGRAQTRTGSVVLGPVEQGEHFGELALMDGQPRSATVIADTPLRLARLDLDRYGDLAASAPAVALAFVQALLGGVGMRLRGVTDSLREVAAGRGALRKTRITVKTGGRTSSTRTGTRLSALLPSEVDGNLVVAALVDRRARSLSGVASSDASVEPLSTGHWEGRRLYNTSQGLLLLEAAARLDPPLRLRMGYSMGFAQEVRVASANGPVDLADIPQRLQAAMQALVAQDVPLREERWRVDEAREHFEGLGWRTTQSLLRTWREPTVPLASYGRVMALQLGPLVPRTGMLAGATVVHDHADGLLLIYGRQGTSPHAVGGSIYLDNGAAGRFDTDIRSTSQHSLSLAGEHRLWLDVLGISSVGEFNERCIRGDVSELIRVVEASHEKRVGQIADAIRTRTDVRVVAVAGPSSAGKTTFIKRLKVQLQVVGLFPRELSLDNYYVDRKETPRDATGAYDYEALEALRVDLLGGHVLALLDGERVRTPRYDFKSGISTPDGGPEVTLGAHEVLLLEGIHALNPQLLPDLPQRCVFRIYLCPLAQLPFDHLNRVHASDIRLLRRIVRDRYRRGADAAANIARWPSVRRGERLHIFPYQDQADAVFDSSLIYEPSVLKVFAERYLLEVPHDHPSYTTAFRLLDLLDHFVTIYPDHVPPTSLLREFIGGSGFHY